MSGLVTLGESMMALVSPTPGPLRHAASLDTGVAGAESNVAIGVARLGVDAAWIGRVGDDEPGAMVAREIRAEGVETHAIVDAAAPTGLLLNEKRTADVSRVSYYRAGSAGSRLSPDDLDPTWFRGRDVVHVTGITPALSRTAADAVFAAVELGRSAGAAVSFDVNFRSRLWAADEAAGVLRRIAELADVLLVGDDEAHVLTDAVGDDLLPALAGLGGAGEVVVKRGPRGAVALVDGERIEAPRYAVTSVDPVGAGDAFAAGYLAARCRGLDAAGRLDAAAAAGAFAVTVRGDWRGAPSWRELDLLRTASGHVAR